MTRHWFIDFDETLATSGITWGLKYAFPRLIKEYHLPFDAARFNQAVLRVQAQDSQAGGDPRPLLDMLFEAMQWPKALAPALLDDIYHNYQPELFEDAIPFLEQLQARGDAVYVVSNNPISPQNVEALKLKRYVSLIVTPKLYPGSQPKPHRSLWDAIRRTQPEIEAENSAMVGDDPWTDGVFAETCGMACWIVDRMDRFQNLDETASYRRVRSLSDIPIEG